jgi:hypothetical protein
VSSADIVVNGLKVSSAYQDGDELIVPWLLKDGRIIELLTPEKFDTLPYGTHLFDIFGGEVVKGEDYIDLDTRGGRLAFGLPDRRQNKENK